MSVRVAEHARSNETSRSWRDTEHAERTHALLNAMRVSSASRERVTWLASRLFHEGYILPPEKAVAITGALFTRQVLMLRGTPGCGKTYLAECLNRVFNPGLPLLKVEGHEEVSVESLLYSQDRIGLELYLRTASHERPDDASWFAHCDHARSRFVHVGPIVQSIRHGADTKTRRVLLVDELDKFRGESEALLLSFLNDYSISVPHLNLYVAPEEGLEPIVIVTANESREIQQPTQRRCVVVPVETPTILDEDEILRHAVRELPVHDRHFVLLLAMRLRSESLGLAKPLSISEVIDFARAVAHFDPECLTAEFVEAHTPYLAKNRRDQYLLGLKIRQCFEWVERVHRAAAGDVEGSYRILAEYNRRQLDARRKRDGDLSL